MSVWQTFVLCMIVCLLVMVWMFGWFTVLGMILLLPFLGALKGL